MCQFNPTLPLQHLIGTYLLLLLCAGLIAPCRDVCCVDADYMLVHIKHRHTRTKKRKRKLFLKKNRKQWGSRASNRRRCCSSGSSERPERCQRSPLRKTDNNKILCRLYIYALLFCHWLCHSVQYTGVILMYYSGVILMYYSTRFAFGCIVLRIIFVRSSGG